MPTKDELTSQVIQEILNILRGTKNFVLDQLPDVVQQVLKWAVAESILLILLGLGFIVIAVFLFKYTKRRAAEDNNKYGPEADTMFAGFGTVIGFLVGSIMSVTNLFCLVKVLVAPKLYLIEYFTDLLKAKVH